ncbi:hypothetical protein MPER_03920, partial [Moniliophthora perniciosa FA553]
MHAPVIHRGHSMLCAMIQDIYSIMSNPVLYTFGGSVWAA